MAQTIDLYEGNGASQSLLQSLIYEKGKSINLTNTGGVPPNDEIKSCALHDLPPGALLYFYDNAGGMRNDDWCEIEVKKTHQQYVVRTLERTYEDEYVRVTYHHHNGLDGKVSRIDML